MENKIPIWKVHNSKWTSNVNLNPTTKNLLAIGKTIRLRIHISLFEIVEVLLVLLRCTYSDNYHTELCANSAVTLIAICTPRSSAIYITNISWCSRNIHYNIINCTVNGYKLIFGAYSAYSIITIKTNEENKTIKT